ncbi:tetratricopeptide repeat protein [Streptomyces sp. NPDC096205]|uniref:tetratricopeptide repeat protein n=1 Tax=Streptomyces sp. NPDC096205 TaxID=3366081 RepID=UPI0037FD0331
MLGEQAVTDAERILGPDHRDTLTARGNLADCYLEAGRTGEAISLAEQVVTDCEALLGEDHPGTLTTRANLVRCTGRRVVRGKRSPLGSRSSPPGDGQRVADRSTVSYPFATGCRPRRFTPVGYLGRRGGEVPGSIRRARTSVTKRRLHADLTGLA